YATESPQEPRRHPLLGHRLHSPALKDIIFESLVSAESPALLADHQVRGMVVVSGPTEISMALDAAAYAFGDGCCAIEDVVIQGSFLPPAEGSRRVQVLVQPHGDQSGQFRIFSCKAGEEMEQSAWKLHVSGKASVGRLADSRASVDRAFFDQVKLRCT